MKFVALVSGGKDSCFNIMHCLAQGHELAALANLYPPKEGDDELDSYMYQTVGHDILTLYSKCIGKPMYRQVINGKPQNQNLEYKVTLEDETEDLFLLLSTVLKNHPDIEGVSVGAILSSYQRTRVEDVCKRLGLTALSFLWQRDQGELMQEMCQSDMDARIIKVAAIGLDETHLGLSLKQIQQTLIDLNSKFGVHICGEGGEFETSVLDAPFFVHGKIVIVEKEIVRHTNDSVWYLRMKVDFLSEEKPSITDWTKVVPMPPLLNEKFQDINDFVNATVEESIRPMAKIERPSSVVWKERVVDTGDKVYISNLYSNANGVELQVTEIFNRFKHLLNANGGLRFEHVQSCQLILADMSKFAQVNSIYTKYFTNPLPPSRICVESNLPVGIDLQLSAVVTKNLKSKSGLHVQGRSYWAPSNIGPYSQSISCENDLISRLSGQIPLIPATMELGNNPKLNALLALQHYDNIKEVTGYTNNLLTICFIKSSNYVELAREVFNEYMCFDTGKKQLAIVCVTELPKSADIEWGGMAFKQDTSLNYESDDDVASDELSAIDKVSIDFVNNLDQFQFDTKTKFYSVYGAAEPSNNIPAEFVPVIGVWSSNERFNYAIISQ